MFSLIIYLFVIRDSSYWKRIGMCLIISETLFLYIFSLLWICTLWSTWLRLIISQLKERIATRRNLNFDKKMKNSVSDRSFYIESSDDEDLEKELDNGEDDGNESDSSGLSMNNQNHKQSSSYNTAAWPKSYRFRFSPFHLFRSSFCRFYPSISSASNLLSLIVRLESLVIYSKIEITKVKFSAGILFF